ncbi:D-2-hydroxyacid dehydrogenase [Kiritimatiellota bacterium B12222]|nr:D-2-hydroxyacid dehydrogenase [Kiritimatiellota bacterium B12222]
MKKTHAHICILDSFTTDQGVLDWSALQSLGTVDVYERTGPEEVLSRCAGKTIVITNKVPLDKQTISLLPDCKLICLLSTGTNAVDLEATRQRGIPVCNIPAYSSDSVAELVFAFLLHESRRVDVHAHSVRQGEWTGNQDFCYLKTPQKELRGKVLGLVGFGDIAQSVCRIAKAFGLRVLATTPHPEGKPALGQDFVSRAELLAQSDFVSLHCPLTPETNQLVNEAFLKEMKAGAVLINTGRGGLLDESAVAQALGSGHVASAYLDVLSSEPPAADHPLLNVPNVWITPHIAWATDEARSRLIEILTENVRAWMSGNPQNVVNGL